MSKARLIQLRVSTELVTDFTARQDLVPGTVIYGEPRPEHPDQWVFWIDVPDSPPGAVRMHPWFSRSDTGAVTLRSVEWFDQSGQRIHAPTPAASAAHATQ